MKLSGNVIIDTIKALNENTMLRDAAKQLGLTSKQLLYRIQVDDDIRAVAIERGLYHPKSGENISVLSISKEKTNPEPKSEELEDENNQSEGKNYWISIQIPCPPDKLEAVLKILK